MSRAVILLTNAETRDRAMRWIRGASWGTRLTFQEAKRSVLQNDRMWAMLTDIAGQRRWHGQRLSTEDWKRLFIASLEAELRLVPNLNGDGFVPLGRSSSDLSKAEMSDLIELMLAWGADPAHPVAWSDPAELSRARAA
jgi:hypothetical protein